MVRLEGYERAQAEPAVGRPAPARRPRARARQPAARPAPRRAARRARPQAPRGDADRAQGHPAAGRHHVHLRDPRPGGGAHDERPAGRLQQGPDRAGRRPGRGLRTPRDAASSPASSERRTCSRGEVAASDPRRGRHVHRSGPRRSTWPSRRRPSAPTRRPRRERSATSSTSDPTRAMSSRSTRAPSSSSPSRTCRRPRPRRSRSKARLSASSGSGSTQLPVADGA